MNYVSKSNKNALKRHISLEKKKQKLLLKNSEISNELKEVKHSLPYPIFVKGKYGNSIVAYMSPRKSITIKSSNSPTSYGANYEISVLDLDNCTDDYYRKEGISIEGLNNRITKKEFMEIYNQALSSMKEVMLYSKRVKKEILCEKIIEENEVQCQNC
jgi:hypothetical protein